MMDEGHLLKLAFARVVKKTRISCGLTPQELSDRSNIYIERIYKIEKGDVDANIVEIIRIAMALNMRPAELVIRAEVMAEITGGRHHAKS